MSVVGWLTHSQQKEYDFPFDVTDVRETDSAPSPSVLADVVQEAYWGDNYLGELAARYGFDDVYDRFQKARSGATVNVKRGDFGEAVAIDYLKHVEGYLVPINKLRYKIGTNQTLPGTDCIALKISEELLVEVAYVESKLRTSLDLSVAVSGCLQLKQDAETATPEILTFIARHLRTTNHPLTEIVEGYLFNRDTDLDRYLIMILHEADKWDNRILENLRDEEIELEPLHVYVTKISKLRDLIDDTFSALGAEVIEDDE